MSTARRTGQQFGLSCVDYQKLESRPRTIPRPVASHSRSPKRQGVIAFRLVENGGFGVIAIHMALDIGVISKHISVHLCIRLDAYGLGARVANDKVSLCIPTKRVAMVEFRRSRIRPVSSKETRGNTQLSANHFQIIQRNIFHHE